MRLHFMIVILATLSAGCSEERTSASNNSSESDPVPPEVALAHLQISQVQSQGVKDATVIVHRAYDYKGYTWVNPIDVAKVIAVDVEFRNYTRGLDLDDVDIINGATNENYGSDPQIAILTLEGLLAADYEDSSWPENLSPLRVLLIYAFPKESKTIKLGYWSQDLTPEPIPISGDGPSLPEPKPSEDQVPHNKPLQPIAPKDGAPVER